MPLDIFVPFWGDLGYLIETVESVRRQTNGDWLLTVVDDAYPEEGVARYFARMDDRRISYIRKQHNEGITANYRTCVARASQDLMVILGCDDILLPNYVDVILAAHARVPEAAIIQPGVQVIDERGRVCATLADTVKQRIVKPKGWVGRLLSGETLATSLMHGDWLYWPSLAFRTDKIRSIEFREGFPVTQDLALIMDIIYRGDQLLIEPTLCFSYRRHRASASSRRLLDGSRFAEERAYFAISAERARALGWNRAARAARWRLTSRAHALTLVPSILASLDISTLRILLRHALRH